MATAPKSVGQRKPEAHSRPNAHKRGYTSARYKRQRIAYIHRITTEQGSLMCGICGRSMAGTPNADITIDHITPPQRYGPVGSPEYVKAFHDERNWQPAHRSCNSSKQDT